MNSLPHTLSMWLLQCLALMAPLMLAPAVMAASPNAAATSTVELTQPRFRSYVLLSAVSTCILTEKKAPYELALRSNAAALYTVIRDVHGGRISGMKTVPQADSFTRYLSFQISASTLKICKPLVPAGYLKLVEATAASMQQKEPHSLSPQP